MGIQFNNCFIRVGLGYERIGVDVFVVIIIGAIRMSLRSVYYRLLPALDRSTCR